MDFQDVEKVRIKYARKLSTVYTVLIIVVVAIIASAFAFKNTTLISFSFVIVFVVVPFLIIVFHLGVFKNERKAYHICYREYFVTKNLEKVFTDLTYNHEIGIGKGSLYSTGMIRTGDVFTSNDWIYAKYKDVPLEQGDVLIQEEHHTSEGGSTYTTIFKGRWMSFEFPKKFAFKIEIVQKWFPAKKVPDSDPITGRKFEKVEIESPTFHRKFKIYAEDGFETFYVLDPALIDRIETLSKNLKGKLLLCFVDNKLHVALHNKRDAFEPPLAFFKINEEKEMRKVRDEIRTVTDFVDYLKLDSKIFAK